jgi:hypothetical protein
MIRNAKLSTYSYYIPRDTDSLVVRLKKGQQFPCPEGACFNEWKDELPATRILSFYSLGPKIYQLTYEDLLTKQCKTVTKVKGFFISSQKGKAVLHDTIFKEFVEQYLKGEDSEAKLGQWSIKTNPQRHLKNVIQQKVLRNSIFSKRVSFKGDVNSLYTLPYGYTKDMYEEIIVRK